MRRKDLWRKIQGHDTQKSARQYKYLYRQMLDERNIRKAWKNLRKGKTKRREVKRIEANFDHEVERMRLMIKNTKPPDAPVEHPELAFMPRKHKVKIIFEHGKRRKIYIPEIHEQWLHHIIVLILAPIIMRTAYRYSCGSFPGRGAHYGKRQVEKWISGGNGIRNFAKIDIRHFYDNVRLDILMRELSTRIKDTWFLYIIWLCLREFKKGLPLGFYISQWLANYLLEPLDRLITEKLGFKKMMRYMDDIVFFDNAKKALHRAVAEIRKFLGWRFRLKLKKNMQVCRMIYQKKDGSATGRPLDYMGFVFYRERTIIRKRIMLAATRTAARLHKAKEQGRRYYETTIRAMLSDMGWFDCTDSYGCYLTYIKPCVDIGKLKEIVSKLDRRKCHESMENGALQHAA